MIPKILVADDSPTIQKVISITLANMPNEIKECTSSDRLLELVKTEKYALVLLDFNLSDDKSGYELAKIIKRHDANVPILAMLGTFDTVDQDQLQSAGINDSITKPFEGTKFIRKCQELLAKGTASEDTPAYEKFDLNDGNVDTQSSSEQQEESEFEEATGEFNVDRWKMDVPNFTSGADEAKNELQDEQEELEHSTQAKALPNKGRNHLLEEELEGWGMSVPAVLETSQAGQSGSDDDRFLFPPIIDEAFKQANDDDAINWSSDDNSNKSAQKDNDNIARLPSKEDLDYPDLGFDQSKIDFINQDNLDNPNDLLVKKTEEEISPDNFWAADSEDMNKPMAMPKHEPIEFNMEKSHQSHTIDTDAIVNKIVAQLMPIIESKIKSSVEKYCQERIDKVAWEVIPDLAENLIRDEIKQIAQTSQQK